jgi:stringent starvation protein B
MNGHPLPPKKEVALALLERGSVHVHLDPRAEGVVVPAWFKRQPQLVLQVGLNMPVPIPDLRIDEDGMSCTLSFNRSPFFCVIPWSSAYAMVGEDGRGMVWPDDVPPEVASQARSREAEPAAKSPAGARSLAVVKSPSESPRKPAPKATARPRALRGGDAADPTKTKKPRTRKARPTAGDTASPATPDGLDAGRLLSPVPAPKPAPRPAPPAPEPSPAAAARPSPADGHPTARPARPAGKPGGSKAKREIPPYLRVVK